jgi:PASTA domain
MSGVHHRAGAMLALLSMSILPEREGYMAVRKIALIIKGSMLVVATVILAACGGGSDGNSVSTPNVVGDTQAAASTAITGAGLTVGAVTQASSATVANGNVISETPAATSSVAKGSAVALVVSSGPPTFTIGGTLIGLAPSATVHVLNGADSLAISANGSFTLPTAVASGKSYGVTVGTPTSTQTCAVQDGAGTIASAAITNVLVYCTYNVSAATLHSTYTTVAAWFGYTNSGTPAPLDALAAQTYDGVGTISGTETVNAAGTIVPNVSLPGTYTVTTTDAIPLLNNGGGIEGLNGAAAVGLTTTSGTPPVVGITVLPSTTATTASINGNYTLVDLSTQLSNNSVYGYEATITLTNGSVAGTFTQNIGGTITTGNPASAQWTVANGVLTSVGAAAGAVSADGDLIVLADTNSGDGPFINVAVPRGSGVTQAAFEGVYSVVEYGGTPVNSTFGKAITLFAYGNGTYSLTFTKNANGTITTNNTATGTYTVADDGTLTINVADGEVYNGAISADGNALVLSSVASSQNPAIFVGVRQ